MENTTKILMDHICHEMDLIASQIGAGKFDDKDLERLDKLAHTKKSLLTIKAMEEADEYSGMSGARGRSPSTGRYTSYADGYRSGYSEAMSQMAPPYPMPPRY